MVSFDFLSVASEAAVGNSEWARFPRQNGRILRALKSSSVNFRVRKLFTTYEILH